MILPNPFKFVAAMARVARLFILGEDIFAPVWMAKYRARVCRSCAFYEAGQCSKCTCFVGLKSILRSESCPIGHWGRLDTRLF